MHACCKENNTGISNISEYSHAQNRGRSRGTVYIFSKTGHHRVRLSRFYKTGLFSCRIAFHWKSKLNKTGIMKSSSSKTNPLEWLHFLHLEQKQRDWRFTVISAVPRGRLLTAPSSSKLTYMSEESPPACSGILWPERTDSLRMTWVTRSAFFVLFSVDHPGWSSHVRYTRLRHIIWNMHPADVTNQFRKNQKHIFVFSMSH